MKIKVLLAAFLISFINIGFSQVVVNEFSASNLESFRDRFGKTEDWIELYNTSDQAMDISGWHLSDKSSKPGKWDIPEGTIIPGNGHLVFLCSGRDGIHRGEYHTNFKLSQTKGSDIILFTDNNENVLEEYALGRTLVEHSHCRSLDGSDEWKICTEPTYGSSNIDNAQYSGYTLAPSLSLQAGFYEGSQEVTITNNEPNSVLRYTLDGTNPRSDSPIYETPITINQTTVVKAQSFSNDENILTGRMGFATYFINEDFSLAVFSVAADEVIDLANGDGWRIPIGTLEYFDSNQEFIGSSFGDLNRHGQDSWVLPHRSLDWVSRDERGYSKALEAELFGYSDRDEYQRIMFRNSGDDNYPAINDFEHRGSTHIRDEYVQNLSHLSDLELDRRAVERVVLFLNGEYWGVYGLREKAVDHDYTSEYYDQGKYEIQYLATWGVTQIEYGDLQALADWENFRNFVLQEDMSVPQNYQVVKDTLNVLSLIDYMLVNLNVVAKDWLNYNTGWWRGLNPDEKHKKWGYLLWDLDATFDYYINYTGIPNSSPTAEPCDLLDISDSMDGFFGTSLTNHQDVSQFEACNSIQNGTCPYQPEDLVFQYVIQDMPSCCSGSWNNACQSLYDDIEEYEGSSPFFGYWGNVGMHEKIFHKLIDESPEFKQLYYSRYADLMNTTFSCDNMLSLLDSMVAVIHPEMPKQIDRWGGTMSEWESNVSDLRDFVVSRCEFLPSGLTNCYEELNGPYEVVLNATPEGIGEIDFNTLDIEQFPWSGSYYGGMPNKLKANIFDDFEDDYVFSHWETSSDQSIISPSVMSIDAELQISTADTITAVFVPRGSSGVDDDFSVYDIKLYPNPAVDHINVALQLEKSSDIKLELRSVLGQKVQDFNALNGQYSQGDLNLRLSLGDRITTGTYFLMLKINGSQKLFELNIIRGN